MGLLGIIKFLARRTLELSIIVLLILFLPRIPPEGSFSKPYKVAPAKPFEGGLSLNEKLKDVEVWHKGDLHGPEAFADYKGELYTTLHGGDVVKLVGNHITPVVKFGKPCSSYHEEQLCGRPLGMAFDKNGVLYVADCYYGLFRVDVVSGDKQRLVAFNEVIGGKNVTLPNSVAVASNGDLFWTDSSTEFTLQDGVFDMLADGSGRLIHYDAKTKKNKVLIPDIHFANGVALSEDEGFVVVAETARNRLRRYYLKGPKKGTHDIFVDGLPGMTDNIKSDGKGGFLVPLVVAVDADNPAVSQALSGFPLIRKFLARSLGLVEFSFKLVNDIYPNEFAQRGVHMIGHFTSMTPLSPKRFTLLHISKDGKVLDSLHSFNKNVGGFSEAHVFRDTLYLGSPFNDYIGRIPLAKIGWEHLKPAPTTQAPKPTTQAPKPTTQTPKPTTQAPKPTTQAPKPTTQAPKPTTPPPTQAPKPKTPPPTQAPKPTTTTTTPKSTTTAPKVTTAPPKEAQSKPVKEQARTIPVKEQPQAKKN